MNEDALFFVGQKAIIEHDGNVLVLNVPIEGLDFPGGKIQIGEVDFPESLKREVREETSLEIKVGEPFATWSYELPASHPNAGQRVFLIGYKASFLSGEVNLSDEHDSYRWVNKDNYKELDDHSEYFNVLKKYFNS